MCIDLIWGGGWTGGPPIDFTDENAKLRHGGRTFVDKKGGIYLV